ncbi:phage tail protein [Pseudomonas sp. LP_7_YM]|uniref:phage tail protein n=1 Tax=Pseudomonas sp. LP_7_YM TaxID=2485137 RepID=UPI00105BDF65|nr:phage tail protein [Pseudomonas sp. LP_7_YM]TDV70190.1 tail tube protein [Pseudomonas sp. LP_7_YM]
MAFKLPNGAILEIATTLAAANAVSAISNASPAVATAAAHGLKDGDVVVVRSGWTRLNDKAVRVTGSDTGTFKLEGIDTTKTTVYAAGAGTGSVRAVTAWAQISQITEVASTGGEQQFATFGFLEEDEDRQVPTTKSPVSMTFTVADDPLLPYVAVCETADQDKDARALRLTLPNGSVMYYNAYVSITSTPTLSRNNIMTRVITLSLASRPTRYQVAG